MKKTIEKNSNIERLEALIVDIQRFSVHDGPGIRTTIFFKGCPLNCIWCQNPEAINPKPQLGYRPNRCINCKKCSKACPEKIIKKTPKKIKIEKCLVMTGCRACVNVCPSGALEVAGRYYTVKSTIDVILKDKDYYDSSGGGITCSGGEPTFQWQFVYRLMMECKRLGISTAMETCGYFSPEILNEIFEACDFLLFDLKHLDDDEHVKLTGRSNSLILKNLKVAKEMYDEVDDKKMFVRMPLIPGLNDQPEHLKAVEKFLLANGVREITLLPYHGLYLQKIDQFFLKREKLKIEPYSKEQLDEVRSIFKSIKVMVGG
ncbi:MAG: glycyl-radical enzyme activating protein [Promethearchaeota archaeon]